MTDEEMKKEAADIKRALERYRLRQLASFLADEETNTALPSWSWGGLIVLCFLGALMWLGFFWLVGII